VSVRTLWTWEHAAPKSPGRPKCAEKNRQAARAAVHELLAQTGAMGGRAAWERLGRAHPLRVVRAVVKEWKLSRRTAARDRREDERQHMEVLVRGAVWCLDATHVGRDAEGKSVMEEVVRDECSRDYAGVGASVLGTLEKAAAQNGWPLLVREDNGGENQAPEVVARLKKEKVIVLPNLPRVPQHNPRAERGMRELKEITGLGKGCVVVREEAEADLEWACGVLNAKPRACFDWKSSDQACAEIDWWYSRVSRDEIYTAVCAARQQAVQGVKGKRAQRSAEREATFAVLEQFHIIKRWRGRTV
jgi:hypothetical protein